MSKISYGITRTGTNNEEKLFVYGDEYNGNCTMDVTENTPSIISMIYDKDNVIETNVFVDGDNLCSNDAGDGDIDYNGGANENQLLIGRADDPSTELRGQMAEIIIFNTKITEAERIIVHNYLSAKYDIGIAVTDKGNALTKV